MRYALIKISGTYGYEKPKRRLFVRKFIEDETSVLSRTVPGRTLVLYGRMATPVRREVREALIDSHNADVGQRTETLRKCVRSEET